MTGLPPPLRTRAPVRTRPRLAGHRRSRYYPPPPESRRRPGCVNTPAGSVSSHDRHRPPDGHPATPYRAGEVWRGSNVESIRCGQCGALLFRASPEALRGPLEIKCRRCGTITCELRAPCATRQHSRRGRAVAVDVLTAGAGGCPHSCTGITRPRSEASARVPFNSGWRAEGDARRAGWSSAAFSVDARRGTPGWVCRCPFRDRCADARAWGGRLPEILAFTCIRKTVRYDSP